MTFKMPRNLMAAVSVVAFAALLSSCGGGGGGSPVADAPAAEDDSAPSAGPMIAGKTVPSGTTFTLPEGTDAPNVTFFAVMGETVPVAGIGIFTCVSADGCSVAVADDVVTTSGDIAVVSLEITDAAVLTQLAAATAEPPVLTELEQAQADAATAATDAQTAATTAQTAADDAQTARENRAAIQTGDFHAGNSGELADKAQEHATAAQDAADAAKTASNTAADPDATVSSATRALVMAEGAQETAEEQQMYAETARDDAVTAAAGEISIVDKTKTVDGTSITIDGMTHSSTVNNVTNNTGLQAVLKITTLGEAIPGTTDNPVTADVVELDVPGADERPLDIGFTYDSADDNARVTLVNSYASTRTVTAFADTGVDDLMGAPGKITYDVDGTATTVALSEASGTFVLAPNLGENDNIAEASKPVTLYSYTNADGEKEHVRVEGSATSVTTGAVVTNTYQHVTIRAGAKIPEATEYSHLHFGVWSGLNGEADGTNTVADLGIGFVANIGEMTSNMPNFGAATYDGNWVANVQAANDDGAGGFSRHDGEATMMADFGKGSVDVTLTGLAELEGTIDDNRFSGTKATLVAADDDVNTVEARDMLSGTFAGNFSGAFFGPLAAEAGGVFDFASDDDKDGANEGGAFRGAFGGDRK